MNDAMQLVLKDNLENTILGIAETDESYIFGMDRDGEAYETVNKRTMERGSMWIWEYMHLYDMGKARVLKK